MSSPTQRAVLSPSATTVPTVELVESLQAALQEAQGEIAQLKAQLDWFKQQLFGTKSERRLIVSSDQQPLEFGEEAKLPPIGNLPTETVTYQRRKAKARPEDCATDAGLRFNDSMPVEVIEVPVPQLQEPDGDDYEIIDFQITHRLAQRPASYVILEYRQPVVRHQSAATLITVTAPNPLWEGSVADVSVIAGILVDKFAYHQPLYRQHQRFQDAGVTLSRSTLTQWVQKGIELLRPIYDAQLAHILSGKLIAVDETPIRAGPAKGKMKQAWFWPVYGEADEICFTFSSSRAKAHLDQVLNGFEGTLLSDGYSAYERFAQGCEDVVHAQCWSHTRRKFLKAEQIEPEATVQALSSIQGLYRIEAEIRDRGLEGVDKLHYRTTHARPIVDAFFSWVDGQCHRSDLLPKSPLATALTYARQREGALRVYLTDPQVPIDTNHLERALRPLPMGRKNWLFSWTETGAQQVGIVQSLISTCRLHGVNPYTYLVDVLQRVSLHPASKVEELTPKRWKELFAAHPLLSDLDKVGK